MTTEMRCKIYAVVIGTGSRHHWHYVIVIEWLPANDSVDISFEHAFILDVWLGCNAFNYVCKLYWIRLPDAHCGFGVQFSIT